MKITFDFDEKSGVVSVTDNNKGRFAGHPSAVTLLKGVIGQATKLLKVAEVFDGACAWRVASELGDEDEPDPAYSYRGCNGNHVVSNARHGVYEGDPCVACGRPIKFLQRSAL